MKVKNKVEDAAYKYYLQDLVSWFQEEVRDNLEKLNELKKSDDQNQDTINFYDGKLTAYYQVLSHMLNQAEGFQLSLKDINLDKLNPDDIMSGITSKPQRSKKGGGGK